MNVLGTCMKIFDTHKQRKARNVKVIAGKYIHQNIMYNDYFLQ